MIHPWRVSPQSSLHRCCLAALFALQSATALALEAVPDSQPRRPARPPNIVFILADDLGINDLGCYGRREHATSHLDKLAGQSQRFTAGYCAQPICSPSRAAILTGKHPARLHLTTYLPGRPDAPSQSLLHPLIRQQVLLEEITVAERLKGLGYATACIGKWHLGGAGFGPEKQGFDEVFAGEPNTKPNAYEGGKGEFALTRNAEKFIADHRDCPFFLYLPHNTPHIPLAAGQDLIDKHKAAFNPLYAAVIESLDATVGRLLAQLDALKLADNTLVIFTSDNGGLHVLEGANTPATHNGQFRAGKGYLYEGGLRVPLLVRWPGHIKPGVCDVPVVNTDWTPTLLEIAGGSTTDAFDGVSLVSLLTTGKPPAARPFFWHFPHYTNQGGRPAGAVRDGDWKLIEHDEDGRLELFNLAADPGEQRNLAAAEPDRARMLREKLAAWRTAIGAQRNTPNPSFDAALAKRIYADIDTSNLPPTKTAAEQAVRLRSWRQLMDSAPRAAKKPTPAK